MICSYCVIIQVTYILLLGCPWKGILGDLNNHLKCCPFDDKRISVNIRKKLNENTDLNKNIESNSDYTEFNNINGSLKARLYQKNPKLIGKILDEGEDIKHKDILDILTENINNKDDIKNENLIKNKRNRNNILSTADKDESLLEDCEFYKEKSYDYNNENDKFEEEFNDQLKQAILFSLLENSSDSNIEQDIIDINKI